MTGGVHGKAKDLRLRLLEDFSVGEVFTFGPVEVTEGAIVSFAEQFDPQPFHVDPVVASASQFGGLIAVGWHTCLIGYRLAVDHLLQSPNLLAGLGMDKIRLHTPVRPGDRLSVAVNVVEVVPSSRTPERGALTLGFAVFEHDEPDVPVATYQGTMLWRRRPH